MEPAELDELLDEYFPDLSDRPRAREFGRLTPDERGVWLFAQLQQIRERQIETFEPRLTRIEQCIQKMTTGRKVTPHVLQSLYATIAAAGAWYLAITGRAP